MSISGDVIEVLDIRLRPSDRYLRRSVSFVFSPLVQYRGAFAAFLYSSFCIHGIVKIFLARIVTIFHSSWNDISGTVVRRNLQRCRGFSDSVHCALIGSKPDTTLTHVHAFSYVRQARKTLNSRRGLFQLDQLHAAHLADSVSWFYAEDYSTFRQIVTNRFCVQFFVDLSSLLHFVR